MTGSSGRSSDGPPAPDGGDAGREWVPVNTGEDHHAERRPSAGSTARTGAGGAEQLAALPSYETLVGGSDGQGSPDVETPDRAPGGGAQPRDAEARPQDRQEPMTDSPGAVDTETIRELLAAFDTEELYGIARVCSIAGRSQMERPELLDALTAELHSRIEPTDPEQAASHPQDELSATRDVAAQSSTTDPAPTQRQSSDPRDRAATDAEEAAEGAEQPTDTAAETGPRQDPSGRPDDADRKSVV